jgi:glutamate decarboxylase
MPADIEDLTVMRVVFRNGVSMDLTRLLVDDLTSSLRFLDALPAPLPIAHSGATAFHH